MAGRRLPEPAIDIGEDRAVGGADLLADGKRFTTFSRREGRPVAGTEATRTMWTAVCITLRWRKKKIKASPISAKLSDMEKHLQKGQ